VLLRLGLLGVGMLALTLPATAQADDVIFGSSLADPANAVPYQNGWDQTVFNTAGPGAIAAPGPSLARQVRLRGMAADGKPLRISFRVVRPVAAAAGRRSRPP
jgi:hypothetical protein